MRSLPTVVVLLVIATLAFPSTAFAWGPLTHVHFGNETLRHLAIVTPFVAKLLRDHKLDYLYGCIAADHIIGKNLAPYYAHCHNWQVAFQLLNNAWTASQKACGYGYLSHLAADVIAHNFFVPFKIVESFPSRAAKHAYWELRFDHFVGHETWSLARDVARHNNRENDELLNATLGSTIFSYGTGKHLFAGALLITRLKRWRAMMSYIGRKSPWRLAEDDVRRYERLALDLILGVLIDVEEAKCVSADPVGARNLRLAEQIRRQLKTLRRAGKLRADSAAQIKPLFEERFRESIYSTFRAPSLDAIISM